MGMKKFFYRVAEGDSVLNIAERFNLPMTAVIKDNNLVREVECGDLLLIQPCDRALYKVQATDTVQGLSKRFNVAEQKILQDNGLNYIFYGLNIKV